MEPRLSTSRKWSPLPEDFLIQVRGVFKDTFKAHLQGSVVDAFGKIFPDEILVRVGFRNSDSLKQSNFEISIAYKRNKDNVLKLLHLAVDAIAASFEQFFQSADDLEFPRIWEEVKFEGRTIFVQYTTVNTALESAADKILCVDGSNVAQGDWEDDLTPEQIKAQLGLDSDDSGEH